MTRIQKSIIVFLSVIALALVTGAGIFMFQSYQTFAAQPLGPVLPTSQFTSFPTVTPTANDSIFAQTIPPTGTAAPRAACGGPDIMNIVVIGADTRQDTYDYGLGDAIRLVRVDFVTPQVSVLEFPRDLWVEIPHIADNLDGQNHEKLNQAYLYGQPGFAYWDDPSAGPGLLSLTLNLNFGAQAEHYIAVNMRTFVNIVNAVDGIDINVPDKAASKYLNLPVGENHLNGDEALKLARNRRTGTFGRADNQNLVLCALQKKLTSPKVVTKIPELIKSFQDNILTDFTPEQLGQLACLGAKLPPQNIYFASFPQELFTLTRKLDPVFGKRVSIWDVDFNILRGYVARFHAGDWPEPQPAGNLTSEETEIICQ
jgi:LCP family protein required for cell wall assembly